MFCPGNKHRNGTTTGTTSQSTGTPTFSSDLTATSQNPFLSVQWKDRRLLGSTDGHNQLSTTRTETKPPTIVLQMHFKCNIPGTPAPGHTLLGAEDAFGMHKGTPAHSCGHSSTELCFKPTLASEPIPSRAAKAGRRMEQCSCGLLATDHIHCR